MPACERAMLALKAKSAADLAHKPERCISIAAIEERLIELRENGQPK